MTDISNANTKATDDSTKPTNGLKFQIRTPNGYYMVFGTLNELGMEKVQGNRICHFIWTGGLFIIERVGEQMTNCIPNSQVLTNKLGLLESVRFYERWASKSQIARCKAPQMKFLPETYKLHDKTDREILKSLNKDGELWISKPIGENQGRGIYLIRTREKLQHIIEQEEEQVYGSPSTRIIQRYISNPLLLNGKKFDIRCYMLIASTTPYLVLYHNGYIRVSMYDYDINSLKRTVHLTNQVIQKQDPRYRQVKEDTVWSMEKLNTYINKEIAKERGLPKNWVYTYLMNQMKQIAFNCFSSVRHRLIRGLGYFGLYGMDFMVDDNMKVWLLEVNANPSLSTNCAAQNKVLPDLIRECIHLSIECFVKSTNGKLLTPLRSLRSFQPIFLSNERSVFPIERHMFPSKKPFQAIMQKLSHGTKPASQVSSKANETESDVKNERKDTESERRSQSKQPAIKLSLHKSAGFYTKQTQSQDIEHHLPNIRPHTRIYRLSEFSILDL